MTGASVPTLYILNRNYSSWSLRAWLAIRTLGIKVNVIPLIVGEEGSPELYSAECSEFLKQAGPQAKVPALHVTKPTGENHIVFESVAILEFLAEEHPSLYPSDKFDRAYARSLMSEMATGFKHLRTYCFSVRADYPFDPVFYTPEAEKDLLRITGIWEELRSKAVENKKIDQGFLFGHFTALDSMYAPIMHRIRAYKLADKIPGAHARAYYNHVLNTPEMKEWTEAALAETAVIVIAEMYPHEFKNKSI